MAEMNNEEPKKQFLKSYIYAFISAVLFSLSNFIMAFMSNLKIKEVYP